MSLPDGWREVDHRRPAEIAAWSHDDSGTTVRLLEAGDVQVESFESPPGSFPVELLPFVAAEWAHHQRSRAP
jgi:hypothetical protein